MNIKAYAYKFYNAVAEILDYKVNEGKLIPYGKKNNTPNEIIRIIADSGTGTAAINVLSSFIEADGHTDKTFAELKNVEGQTMNVVLSELVPYTATFKCVIGLVKYSDDGVNASFENIPFEWVRKVKGGGFAVNPYMGCKDYNERENIYYKEWEKIEPAKRRELLAAEKARHGGQRGTIIYRFTKKPGQTIYPVPPFYSAIEDFESDAGLVKMERSNILEGFRPDVIINLVGQPDNVTVGVDGKTALQRQDDELEEFQGPGGRKIFVISSSTKEGLAQVTPFDVAATLDGIDKARDRVPRAICRHTGVPPVLIGLSTPEGLGSTQALANSMKLFNHSIVKEQNLISNTLKEIYPEHITTISTLNIIDFIPDEVLAKLTDEEIRAIGGYEPIESEAPTESQKTLDALNALGPLVANKVLESMTKTQILALVGLKEGDENSKTPTA